MIICLIKILSKIVYLRMRKPSKRNNAKMKAVSKLHGSRIGKKDSAYEIVRYNEKYMKILFLNLLSCIILNAQNAVNMEGRNHNGPFPNWRNSVFFSL